MGIWQRLTGFWENPVLEKRASASGFTAEVISMREQWLSGSRGIAELTGTAQACVSLWESGFAMADVEGTDLLTRRTMALCARSLALRGESVFLIRESKLVPCSDWELSTSDGEPSAYRLSISEAGGGTTHTALAAEVLHIRIGSDLVTPWHGSAPLKRANLTAGLLHAVETALSEIFHEAPIGSQIVPMPESTETDLTVQGRDFRGKRGRVLLRESVNVSAAGGPAPVADWRPSDVTPDLSKATLAETWSAARSSIAMAFGVLPAMLDQAATGPLIREAQRQLATWTLQPIAALLAEEATAKLGSEVKVDVIRPLQAFDAGSRARTISALIESLATAKAAGLDPGDIAAIFKTVDWEDQA